MEKGNIPDYPIPGLIFKLIYGIFRPGNLRRCRDHTQHVLKFFMKFSGDVSITKRCAKFQKNDVTGF